MTFYDQIKDISARWISPAFAEDVSVPQQIYSLAAGMFVQATVEIPDMGNLNTDIYVMPIDADHRAVRFALVRLNAGETLLCEAVV